MKPLKGVEKIYITFLNKKNELRSYDGFGSYDFAKKVGFMKHFYVFMKQTKLLTSRERKSPGVLISKSKDPVNA